VNEVVIGFDPSLTSYGVSDGKRHIRIRTTPEDGDTYARVRMIFAQIMPFLEAHELEPDAEIDESDRLVFVVEGPSFGSAAAGALWDAGYLMARLDILARQFGAEIYVVPPATLKKYVTGKGNTPKVEMALRVFRKWGIEFPDDPGADKLHAYCLHRYGLALRAGEIEAAVPKARGKGKDSTASKRAAARTKAGIA
jgi:hypothetical protein